MLTCSQPASGGMGLAPLPPAPLPDTLPKRRSVTAGVISSSDKVRRAGWEGRTRPLGLTAPGDVRATR